VVAPVEEERVRAWSANADPTTPAGEDPLTKCDASKPGWETRLSGIRVAAFMRCTTASPEVTFWRKHGSG
jgi:hypothetical protein